MSHSVAPDRFLLPLIAVLFAPFVLSSPAGADSCWDQSPVKYPFVRDFGNLPDAQRRCVEIGEFAMKSLGEVRADPSLLQKEAQTGHVYYKNLLKCCSGWLGYECRHEPPAQGNTVAYIGLEGRLCYFGTNTKPVKMACADYARFAVQQNNENITYHCGFTGRRWDSNPANHENWCKVVDPAMPIEETDARYQQLAPCLANVKHVGPAPLAPEIHKRLDQFKLQQH